MATSSFDSIKQRFNREYSTNPTFNKVIDTTMDSAEWIGKNSDTLLLGAACLILGDIAEATESLTLVETVELMQEHPHLF